MKTMATTVRTIAMIPRGWRLTLTKSSRAHRKPTSMSRGRELLRGRQADPTTIDRVFTELLSHRHPSCACAGSGLFSVPTSSRI